MGLSRLFHRSIPVSMPPWQLSYKHIHRRYHHNRIHTCMGYSHQVQIQNQIRRDWYTNICCILFEGRLLYTQRDIQPIPTLISQQQQLYISALSNRSSTLQLRSNPTIPVVIGHTPHRYINEKLWKAEETQQFFATSPSCCHKRISDHTLLPCDPAGKTAIALAP